ncbi:MAG: oxygen-dependent coproporphyrinogen oxidase [Gemmatimonadaceae bacterium]|nr:oxygen-dependent coproporphyrinogen oxidase [Gemmatimonadaceae bacterium]
MTTADLLRPASRRDRLAAWTSQLQDEITALFESLDGGRFAEAVWAREGGGGGAARLLAEGAVFEKAGVNRALVEGILPPEAAGRLGGNIPAGTTPHFFATGVSVVVHPRSPMVPTTHLNVRYFELTDADGHVFDAWYGGGTDLTPTHPFPEDAREFHRALKRTCDAHGAHLYPTYKAWCDEYFRNTHRANEARGVGGVFFDHLRPDEAAHGLDEAGLHAFVTSVGRALATAYAPIVRRRRDLGYTARDLRLQRHRRARYVEFNLLHDRGTLFGLQTGARTESVLMSMPPVAEWPAPEDPEPGSIEAALAAMLVPQDWAQEG